MLTLSNIRNLKNSLEVTLTLCNEILAQREFNKLFRDEKDYRDSKIACEFSPDNFYRCRFFDSDLELRFNNRTKQYYIYFEIKDIPFSIREFMKDFYFSDKFENVNRPSSMYFHYVFNKDVDIDNAVIVYKEFVRYYLFKVKGDLIPDIF